MENVRRTREPAAAGRNADRARDGGFSLIELLIVIVILGVLSVVVVFAVGGASDRGEDATCVNELRALTTAQEALRAQSGTYGDETDLVAIGTLNSESVLFEVSAPGDGTYSIAPAAGSACTQTLSGGTVSPATTP